MQIWRCPRCNSRDVGKIGHDQYYCSDCCVEFSLHKKKIRLFEVVDDGTLISLGESQLITEH